MMKYCAFPLLFVVAFAWCPPARAGALVNVRDFGAKGDGAADDTAAIQKAAKAAVMTVNERSAVGVLVQSGPVLYFPPGKYLLSQPVTIDGVLEIRGEGDPVLIQQTDSADILVGTGVWRLGIEGLTFVGGRHQLNLSNGNIDTGRVRIDLCKFNGASGFGVRTDVRSTTVEMTRCTFIRCLQAWQNNRSDKALMRDCWITSSNSAANMAVIEHRGDELLIENVCGVPLPEAPGQRWIDNYGTSLTCRNVRFGAEGGGFTPIYNFTRYSPGVSGSSIRVVDCVVAANSSPTANGVVYCMEVPNMIELEGIRSAGAVPVIVNPSIDLSDYFIAHSPTLFSYSVRDFIGEVDATLPQGLGKPAIHPPPVPADWLNDAAAEKAMEKIVAAWKPPTKEPAVRDFTGNPAPYTPQEEPEKRIEVTGWRAAGFMDATGEKNADRLMVKESGSDVFILHRRNQPGGWPHIEAEVTVNLDRYPYLAWRQVQGTAPGPFVVKVIDQASGKMVSPQREDQTYGHEFDLWAANLRRSLGVGGERRLTIRFYPLGLSQLPDTPAAQAGQFTVLDFVRLEQP